MELVNLVLVGFDLPDPAAAGPTELLRPRGLLPVAPGGGGGGGVTLRDVRILVTPAVLQQHLRFLAPGQYNRSAVPGITFVYTVRLAGGAALCRSRPAGAALGPTVRPAALSECSGLLRPQHGRRCRAGWRPPAAFEPAMSSRTCGLPRLARRPALYPRTHRATCRLAR
mgnify:CR=1 FL=1